MLQAAVVLIVKDGLILSISRKEDQNKFGLIGGKTNENESVEQSAIRETFEETQIKIISLTELYQNITFDLETQTIPYCTYCFYAESWEGEPVSSDAGRLEWLSVNDLLANGAFVEYNSEVINLFKKYYPSISLK